MLIFCALFALTLVLAEVTVIQNSETEFQEASEKEKRNKCDPDLPTLSVANDNLISSKAEWEAFTKKHTFFVLGVGDSSCK